MKRILILPLSILFIGGVASATVSQEVYVCRYEKSQAQLLITGPDIVDSGEIPGFGTTTDIGGYYDEGDTRTFILAGAEQTEVYCPPDSRNFHINEKEPDVPPAPVPAPAPAPTPEPVAPVTILPEIQGK